MRRQSDMGSFWDDRAAEDAAYFVDNRQDFGNSDMERFWAQGQVDLDKLLELAGADLSPSDEVVEIGCGIGRLTRVLAARTSSVRAVDVSAEMLRKARDLNSELENVEWLHGDGTSLNEVDSDSADGCISHVVFQHVPEPEITLGYVREMGRILRAGGWSAFHVSTDPQVHSRSPLEKARDRLRPLISRGPRGMTNPAWLGSAVSLTALEDTAKAAGLDVAQVWGAGTQWCVVRLVRQAH